MLTTVKLHGFLGKKYGKTFKFAVNNPAEAIRLFKANFKTFEKDLINHQPGFRILVGKETLDEAEKLLYPSGRQCIRIVPVIRGAGSALRIIAGIVLVVVGTIFAQPWMVNMGASLIIGGVIGLLTPTTSTKSSDSESAKNTPSYIFNGAVNTTQQGNPIPVLYGQMLVGSQVISAGLSVSQLT